MTGLPDCLLYPIIDNDIGKPFVIYGQPYSKANNRRLVWQGNRPAFIKSKNALIYEKSAKRQLSFMQITPLTGDVYVVMRIFYKTNLPDLDESLILDVLQGFAYENDRQVRGKFIFHEIDKENPRSEIWIFKRPKK